jgi:uncharacterized protein
MIADPWFYAAAVPAVTLMGLAKGGFAGLGLLALPLMTLVASPVQGAAIMLPILMVQDVVSVASYWGKWDRRNLALLMPGAVFGVLAGYLLAAKVPEAAIELAVGVISIGFGLRHLLASDDLPATRPGRIGGSFWGAVAGFTSMISHAGGPPFQIFVMPQKLPRDVFVGTGVVFFALVNWMKLPPYIGLGQFTAETLWTALALIPVAIASTWAGVVLVQHVSGRLLYKIVYCLLVLLGLKLCFDGIVGLA